VCPRSFVLMGGHCRLAVRLDAFTLGGFFIPRVISGNSEQWLAWVLLPPGTDLE
jgi:hypothetical protein